MSDEFIYTKGEWVLIYSNGMTFGKKLNANFSILSTEHYNDVAHIDNYGIAERVSNHNTKMTDLEFLGNAMLMSNASLMYEKLCELSQNYNLSDDERSDINFILNKIRGGEWE